ncbi:MAG: RagB/SusD family nutrient uptake outer membrane protein [Gemmatimonadetes bacterium]|nr:RagB/SusD family nutrient uptake outer membrane protein [Gemmatimonadota bacterium]
MQTRRHSRTGTGPLARRGVAGALLALLPLAACDFSVVNPGPARDAFLDLPEAAGAVVNGANVALNDAWNEISVIGASLTREYFPAGNTGYKGITVLERQGLTTIEDRNSHWNEGQNARWTAENALERFQRIMEGSKFAASDVVAKAYLLAGYGNRILGETFCEAVIDGGPVQPREVFFQRAEGHFTKAMQVAQAAGKTDLQRAGQAGRASVRLSLGNWSGAAADAKAIPSSFVYRTPFSNLGEEVNNAIYLGTTYLRVATVWNTFYEDYYRQTGDPRTPWIFDPARPTGSAAVGPFGLVPFYPPMKYPDGIAPVNLSSGREMRLIEAEALLVDGKWQEAMTAINALRTSVISPKTGKPLEPWPASSVQDAWTALFRERGIELWLEARRLWDRFRWARDKRPARLDVHEVPSTTEPKHSKGAGTYLDPNYVLCYPIPRGERLTNPNVPLNP